MIAYGPGAYGWLTDNPGEVVQTHNITDIAQYANIMDSPGADKNVFSYGRVLNQQESIGLALGFNYKANQPISFNRYHAQFGIDILNDDPYKQIFDELSDAGFIEKFDGYYLPTILGEAFHEEIISVYLHDRIGNFKSAICKK